MGRTIDLKKRYNELGEEELNILKEKLDDEECDSFLSFLKNEEKRTSDPKLDLTVHELYYALLGGENYLINRIIDRYKIILGKLNESK